MAVKRYLFCYVREMLEATAKGVGLVICGNFAAIHASPHGIGATYIDEYPRGLRYGV